MRWPITRVVAVPVGAFGCRLAQRSDFVNDFAAMTATIRNLLAEVKAGLARVYGARLQGVFLFGSYARNAADAESDFDVLVVLDVIAGYGAEVDRTAELTAELSLQNDVSISTVFVSADDWRAAQTPFLLNVRAEAIAA